MTFIEIKNKLLVIGNYLKVPGFEPLSEQTTNNLSIAMQGANTYIDVDTALKLIPGSRIIIAHSRGGPASGSYGHNKWFELPDGPPPDGNKCPSNSVLDYYKILRDHARVAPVEQDALNIECGEYNNLNKYDCADEFSKGLS